MKVFGVIQQKSGSVEITGNKWQHAINKMLNVDKTMSKDKMNWDFARRWTETCMPIMNYGITCIMFSSDFVNTTAVTMS